MAVRFGVVIAAFALLAAAPLARDQRSDLDEFMARVLAARDENWKKLQQYLLDERERVSLTGPSGVPLWGDERTYTWYIRDGFFVRSPVTANGVTIAEADRRKYEDAFLLRVQRREQGNPAPGAAESPVAPSPDEEPPLDISGVLAQTRRPQFIDNAYFLRFKFESGKYAFVGRETLDGTDVLRIEYYPARLFSREQDAADKRAAEKRTDRKEDAEATMERLMNKVALVTLWVAPDTHQIVKYTFDNVSFDFLPMPSLLRVTGATATMVMGQPFKGVWLPRSIEIYFGGLVAVGTVDVRYHVDYLNHREATTSGRLVPTPPR